MELREGGLDDPQVIDLLRLHGDAMLAASPPGACHFLDLAALKAPDISFWSAWDGGKLTGIGALKTLDARHGELKSMRVADGYRRRGVGERMLQHLIAVAQARGLTQLSLETGSSPTFAPALALYAKHGFAPCPPFGGYVATDFNRFMTRAI